MSNQNLHSHVTTDRRVYEIACGMLYSAILDTVVHLGETPGLGDLNAGEARVALKSGAEDDLLPFGRVVSEADIVWALEEFKRLPLTDPPQMPVTFAQSDVNNIVALEIGASDELGRAKLIRCSDAVAVLGETARNYLTRVKYAFQKSVLTGAKAYRRFESFGKLKNSLADRLTAAKIQALHSAYPRKRGKKGVQRISTRRTHGIPFRGWFQFNGRPSYHGPRGRRPLTEAEWIRRYEARRDKRNESGKPRYKRRKPVKVPKVIGGRPKRPLTSIGQHDTVRPRDVYLGNSSPDLEPLDFFNADELDPVLIAASWPEIDVGQV